MPKISRRGGWSWLQASLPVAIVVAIGLIAIAIEPLAAQGYTPREYGDFPVIGSRAAIWIAAQLHLFFAAFVLGVPMFAVVAEAIGIFSSDDRYDKLAKEFTRLLLVSYSATAIWGAILVFGLITLYRSVHVGLCGDLLFRVVYALPVLLRLGSLEEGSSKMGSLGPWYPAQSLGYGSDVDRQFLAHIHDESACRGYPGYSSRHGTVLECIC